MYTIESSADYGYQSTDDGQEKNLNDADEPSQRAVHQSTSTQSITSSTLTSLPTIISTPVNPVINDVSSVRGSAYFSNIVPLVTVEETKTETCGLVCGYATSQVLYHNYSLVVLVYVHWTI